jgi:hypothetical protein
MIALTKFNASANLLKKRLQNLPSMRGSAESDGDSRALASVSDGRFVLCASVCSVDDMGVEE